MALLSKNVIEEPEYHRRGHKNTIIYYDLIIPLILHRGVGGCKVSVSEKIPQQGIPQFGNGDSEGFWSRSFQHS